MKEPESVRHLAGMINGEASNRAAKTLAGAQNHAFAIYVALRWELKKRDYTPPEVIGLIEAAIERTKKEVPFEAVAAEAIGKYQEMIRRLA